MRSKRGRPKYVETKQVNPNTTKRKAFLFFFLCTTCLQIGILLFFFSHRPVYHQDSVLINEAVNQVEQDFRQLSMHRPVEGIDYTVLDLEETVLFQTKAELSTTINQAILQNDTILDLHLDGKIVGKMIIENRQVEQLEKRNQICMILFVVILITQCIIGFGYIIYIDKTMISPFHKLKAFAQRIAGGNLDIPLEMDQYNLFGAFTESFDIMRSELKKARLAEAKASESKKELIAKLSHDIKTPIASIKASSEVGLTLTTEEKTKMTFTKIMQKTDQITTLINNLFVSTLEELQQLAICPTEEHSTVLKELLENADYMHQAALPSIPDGLILMDKLRLQQVFDNIFANSYKYANTKIDVTISKTGECIAVEIEDYGKGVPNDEILLLTEKYQRGSNAKEKEGAGLGLYICEYLIKQMGGMFLVENGKHGLRVSVLLRLVGKN